MRESRRRYRRAEVSVDILKESGNKAYSSAGIRASRRNNNNVERLNGTVRERNKVMRGLKKEYTSITRGFQIYYNFVKPHMGLNGQTPAQKAGITELDRNRWLDLIKKSIGKAS